MATKKNPILAESAQWATNVQEKRIEYAQTSNECPIVKKRRSKAGYEFDVTDDYWELHGRNGMYVAPLRDLISKDLEDGIILTLAHYVETQAAWSARKMRTELLRFIRFAAPTGKLNNITSAALLSYRQFCNKAEGHDHRFASKLRPFFCKWFELGYANLSENVVSMMKDWRLVRAPDGAAVNRLGVDEGPFMADEHAGLVGGWMSAFERGEISHEDFTLLKLLSSVGRRPLQLMALKTKDLDDNMLKDALRGEAVPRRRLLLIHIPRIKQNGIAWRERFRAVPVSPELWNLLMLQRGYVLHYFDALLKNCNWQLQDHDVHFVHDELPLFPICSAINKSFGQLRPLLDEGAHGEAVLRLRDLVVSDIWHQSIQGMQASLRRAGDVCKATNREGGPLRVYPKRFRYTLEYEMERNGHPPNVIAWQMDHSNLGSLVSYRRNGPDQARPLNKAMALTMAPYVMVFMGKIVDKESDAEGGEIPDVTRLLYKGKGTATCGASKQCGLLKIPECCYICSRFQPWIDGPHEQVLEGVLVRRQERLEALDNLEMVETEDTLILAVVQVIRGCEARRHELSEAACNSIRPGRGTGNGDIA